MTIETGKIKDNPYLSKALKGTGVAGVPTERDKAIDAARLLKPGEFVKVTSANAAEEAHMIRILIRQEHINAHIKKAAGVVYIIWGPKPGTLGKAQAVETAVVAGIPVTPPALTTAEKISRSWTPERRAAASIRQRQVLTPELQVRMIAARLAKKGLAPATPATPTTPPAAEGTVNGFKPGKRGWTAERKAAFSAKNKALMADPEVYKKSIEQLKKARIAKAEKKVSRLSAQLEAAMAMADEAKKKNV